MSSEDVEKCRRNGWGPGTRLIGDEGYGPSVIELLWIGEELIVAREIQRCGEPFDGSEGTWTLSCRDWKPVTPELAAQGLEPLDVARDALSSATGGRPDFEGFARALRSEAAWVQYLHQHSPADQAAAKSDAQALEALADAVDRVAGRLGF